MEGLIDRHSDTEADTTTIDFLEVLRDRKILTGSCQPRKWSFGQFPNEVDSVTILVLEVVVGPDPLFCLHFGGSRGIVPDTSILKKNLLALV